MSTGRHCTGGTPFPRGRDVITPRPQMQGDAMIGRGAVWAGWNAAAPATGESTTEAQRPQRKGAQRLFSLALGLCGSPPKARFREAK